MEKLSHRERLQTILAGEKPDRHAASLWRHFFHMEHDAEGTAEAMLHFQREFDWDFMKINPRADYHVEDWGKKLALSHDEFKNHTKLDFPVKHPDDWLKIRPLPTSAPGLAEHLKVVSILRKRSDRELPLLMTVFSPLAVAGRMVRERGTLAEHLRDYPENVLSALRAITATFAAFVSEVRNAGADGIFFATLQWASRDLVTWEEYRQFGIPFDLQVIRAAEDSAINLLHVCSSNNFLQQLFEEDYPAPMYNWDSHDPTNLPIDRSYDLLVGKTVVGGIDQEGWLLHANPQEVGYQMDRLKSENDPARLIIGPGCVIPPQVTKENLKAIRNKL